MVIRTIVPVAMALLGATQLAAAEPEVIVELSRRRIYEGESAQYRVILNHVENPSPPQLPGFDDFDVTSLGEQSLNSRRVTIINGRRSEIVRYGRAYTYRLTPLQSGLLQIPAPVAHVDGKRIEGRELALEVVAPQDQDVVEMHITADPPSVYPMQPLTVTLSIAIKGLPDRFADRDPTTIQTTSPALQIPWVDDKQLPEGMQPTRDWRHWLSPLENRRGAGFGINNLGSESVFSLFDERRSSAFHPKPQIVHREDKDGRSVAYWQYEFKRHFTPKKIGRYRFGPVTLKGMLAAGTDAAGNLRGEDVYAVAPAIVVTVKDVPEAGRPDSYIGAVGQFSVGAELKPTNASVGDPMTLTLSLTGQGTLDYAYPPDLERNAPIAEQFKVYDATEETEGPTRKFTYSIRPLQQGIQQFPAIPVSYFDVHHQKYVTLHTKPIPIEVTEADRLSGGQIVGTPRGSAHNADDLQLRQEGIFANVTDLSAVRDQSVRPVDWLAAFGGAIALYLAVVAMVWQVRRRAGDLAAHRRQAAASRARQRLRDAAAEMKTRRFREGADHVRAALVGLVADMADLPEAGLTPRDVETHLSTFGLENGLVDRVRSLLQTCDAARYGASDAAVGNLLRDAQEVLPPLTKQLKAKRRSR